MSGSPLVAVGASTSFAVELAEARRFRLIRLVSEGTMNGCTGEEQIDGCRRGAAMPRRAPLPDAWPAEARPWLAASPCVQSDDPLIRATARRLAAGTRDELSIVRSVLAFQGRLWKQGHSDTHRYDAVSALSSNGSRVGNANLVAALLRADGIPARILPGVPTWGGPVGVHPMVEVWLGGYGWYRIESSRGDAPLHAHAEIICSIASHDAEVLGSAYRAGGYQCLPWLAAGETASRCLGCQVGGLVTEEGAGQIANLLDASL